MQLESREVILLKPTPAFLSFLAGQLPETVLPAFNLLQTDTTAYTLPLHETEEALLETIEALFPTMFQHEIKRWLGDEAALGLNASFLDFLCCFKFEVHSHMLVLESAFENNQQLLRVKPRSLLLKKMQAQQIPEDDTGELATVLEQVSLSYLIENATVIIKHFNHLKEIRPFIEQFCLPIFKMEMMRVSESRQQWPSVGSFEDFSRYFSIDIHSNVVHLNQMEL
ncbi:MAG: hypothetical protein K0U24_08100 [Gammaproteobacteria bacterium]|nr:hypothetical protein [Gammaproteobacteria bacterium]MCH9764163.1 hypothetical protein [Gammaproteobacteria bacterium]